MNCRTRTLLLLTLLVGCADEGFASMDEAEREAADSEGDSDNPVLAIENGTTVRGAGPNQEWEGIVMTQSASRGYCSASFITERHLLSAAHCFGSDGTQRVGVRAPTWNSGTGFQAFDRAVVRRASTNNSVDIAIVDLGVPQAWATPQRRFLLNAAAPATVQLHLYGYGAMTEAGAGIGTLRGAPKRATITVSAAGTGYLMGTTADARFCKGDSGGPAIKEGTAPVIWGINQSFIPTAARARADRQPVCADVGSRMRFTSVAANLAFIERTLGRACKRLEVDGQQVAQCWE